MPMKRLLSGNKIIKLSGKVTGWNPPNNQLDVLKMRTDFIDYELSVDRVVDKYKLVRTSATHKVHEEGGDLVYCEEHLTGHTYVLMSTSGMLRVFSMETVDGEGGLPEQNGSVTVFDYVKEEA